MMRTDLHQIATIIVVYVLEWVFTRQALCEFKVYKSSKVVFFACALAKKQRDVGL